MFDVTQFTNTLRANGATDVQIAGVLAALNNASAAPGTASAAPAVPQPVAPSGVPAPAPAPAGINMAGLVAQLQAAAPGGAQQLSAQVEAEILAKYKDHLSKHWSIITPEKGKELGLTLANSTALYEGPLSGLVSSPVRALADAQNLHVYMQKQVQGISTGWAIFIGIACAVVAVGATLLVLWLTDNLGGGMAAPVKMK